MFQANITFGYFECLNDFFPSQHANAIIKRISVTWRQEDVFVPPKELLVTTARSVIRRTITTVILRFLMAPVFVSNFSLIFGVGFKLVIETRCC